MVSTPCLSCHFLQNIRQLKSLGRLHYRLRRNCTLLDGFRRQGSCSSRVHVEVATFGEEGEEGRGKREEKAGSAQGWVLWGHVPAASPGMGLPPSLCVCMPLWWHMQNQFLGFSARNSIVLSFLLGNIRKAGKKQPNQKKLLWFPTWENLAKHFWFARWDKRRSVSSWRSWILHQVIQESLGKSVSSFVGRNGHSGLEGNCEEKS